ncbi:MAG: TetR family transcriptional regulator [Corynebacterium sp.]|nr:TetR family transcriptional regulator [Corynebacterium sp.]
MRTSKKDHVLRSAIEIVEKQGLPALTYESLAEASGLSKSGLIYYFPSRRALLLELHQYLAAQLEAKMVELAGGAAHEVSDRDRIRASFLVMSQSASLADLRMTLEAIDQDAMQPWLDVLARWSVSPDETPLYLLQVIADGLWVHDHINGFALSQAQRQQLTEQALTLLDDNL